MANDLPSATSGWIAIAAGAIGILALVFLGLFGYLNIAYVGYLGGLLYLVWLIWRRRAVLSKQQMWVPARRDAFQCARGRRPVPARWRS